mgnify:CR=1 FL=1
MPVDKNLALSGVIGDPIAHSKSPIIHNFWLRKNNLNCFYVPIKVSKGELEKKIICLKELGFSGVNVTIPHKVDAFNLANEVTEEAKRVGAANTLYFENNLIIGDNTDSFGFKHSILRNFPFYNFKKEKVLIFGAGGASRAVLSTCLKEKAKEIRLINRNKQKAQKLKEKFSESLIIFDWEDFSSALNGATTIINTTSLGNLGCDTFPFDLKGINKNAKGIDLVYNPIQTSFMKKAKRENIKCINGLDMLIYQAIPGFKRWFNKKPVYSKELLELLVKSLEKS